MNKHAYLIIAHNNWKILKYLLQSLDKKEHDFFIHIDIKAKGFNEGEIKAVLQHSNIRFIDRKDVRWADYSQIDVTLDLLQAAKEQGDYSYYHLLSGVDMPLKPAKIIYEFFENSGDKEFIGIVPNEVYYSVRRVKFYHPLVRNRYFRGSKVLKGIDRVLELCQKIIGINRLRESDYKIIDGWQWFSITDNFCEYVLSKREEIEKMFHSTIASDELVFQTLIYNSKDFYEKIYCNGDLKTGSMRYIDWKRGKPYTWGQDENDFEMLVNSPYMFARKFDESTNFEIVEQIFEHVTKETV